MSSKDHQLNDKQEKFCHEYIKTLNATQSAIAAGYSEKAATQTGSRLLTNAKVTAYLSKLKAKVQERAQVDAQYVLNRLVEIDNLDVIDIVDDHGNLLPIREWPRSWRISISAIDVRKIIQAGDDDKQLEQVITKVKWPDKARNLEMLGKHVEVKAWERDIAESADAVADALRDIAGGLPG